MTARQWLMRVRGTETRINALMEARARMRAAVTRTTASWSGMPGGGDGGDRMLAYVARLEEIDRQIDGLMGEHLAIKQAAIDAIERVEDARYRDVLMYRYVNVWTWRKIATMMFCDERTARRWHDYALIAITPFLSGFTC